jgi:hypothetical protein
MKSGWGMSMGRTGLLAPSLVPSAGSARRLCPFHRASATVEGQPQLTTKGEHTESPNIADERPDGVSGAGC